MAQKAPVANGRRNLGITCSTRPQCAKPRKVPARSPAENGGLRAFVHSSIQTTVYSRLQLLSIATKIVPAGPVRGILQGGHQVISTILMHTEKRGRGTILVAIESKIVPAGPVRGILQGGHQVFSTNLMYTEKRGRGTILVAIESMYESVRVRAR